MSELKVRQRRRVGMADEADSKSVVGNHVWVQVPPPAVKTICEHPGNRVFFCMRSPMQREHAAKAAHEARGEQRENFSCSNVQEWI